MMKNKKKNIPPIGMRIVKSAAAVGICFCVAGLLGNKHIVFYSLLAALWCVQTYVTDMKKHAFQRITGTIIGAVYGLLVLLLQQRLRGSFGYPFPLHVILVSVIIIAVLYTTVLLHKKQASYFSCVVFLSIVVNHINEANPYLFVWYRFIDTMLGIVVGIGVNSLALPRRKRKDVLFISGLDDFLFDKSEKMTDYSRAELNRMLDEGIHFTVATVRTPALIMETMGEIRLKLPVIAMDGAVLYDIVKKEYKKVYVISQDMAAKIAALFYEQKIHCFVNVIIDDMLIIYYGKDITSEQEALVMKLRQSPYRNYVRRSMPADEDVVYFLVYEKKCIIEKLYGQLSEEGYGEHLKIVYYDSIEKPGYSYLKIYNKNANKKNMIEYLKKDIGIDNSITFGNIPDQYDIVVKTGNVNKTVQILKRLYEPFIWSKYRNGGKGENDSHNSKSRAPGRRDVGN